MRRIVFATVLLLGPVAAFAADPQGAVTIQGEVVSGPMKADGWCVRIYRVDGEATQNGSLLKLELDEGFKMSDSKQKPYLGGTYELIGTRELPLDCGR